MQKNSLFKLIVLICISLPLTACVAKQNAVTFPETIYTTHGFAIQLPRGNTWLHKTQNDTLISYKKLPREGTHSFYAGATEIVMESEFKTPEDFLDSIKKQKESNTAAPGDYRIIMNEYKLEPDIAPFCVYYHLKYEDHVAKNRGANEFLILENFGYAVLHPEEPKLGIDIWYSERYAEGEASPELQNEGNEYLRTLRVVTKKEMQKLTTSNK